MTAILPQGDTIYSLQTAVEHVCLMSGVRSTFVTMRMR